MNLLIIAATEYELSGLRKLLSSGKHQVRFLVSGVGMVAATYATTKAVCEANHDLVLNIGIAGTIDRNIKIGDVVEVVSEEITELGAEDGSEFVSAFNLNLTDKSIFSNPFVSNFDLPKVRGISVNTVHGNEKTIASLKKRSNGQVESMEGAGFFYSCLQSKVKFAQIRAISNYVESRNKDNWNVELALENLSNTVHQIITTL